LTEPSVEIQILPHGDGLPLPAYATVGSAGMDLRAAVDEPIVLEPGKRCLVPTGLRIALPEGYEAQIRPRSGLAIKQGITVANAPGTVDSDYRGEVQVGLVNLSDEAYTVRRGDRIAQMVVAPVTRVAWQPVESLDETDRGAGGFGSTGS
jgi:dUTP pyrophosphatase